MKENNFIQVTGRMKIHDTKLDAFRAVAAECLRKVKEMDTGTLQYEWFLSNEDEMVCHVRETYVDSNAVLVHTANLGETWPTLLGLVDLELEFYGEPSAALIEAASGLNVKIYSCFQGIYTLTDG